MKKKNIVLCIILIFIIILGIILINFKSHKTYTFILPSQNKVVSVGIEKSSKNKLISNDKELKNIYNIFKDKYRTVQTENYKDGYMSDKIQITFYYEDSVATIINLYEFKDKYYLEQVNNGIYLIDKDIYQRIEKYFQ